VEASEQIHTRDPECCRARAERLFSHMAMAKGYVHIYESLITTGKLPACN